MILFHLLIGHILGDFVFQPNSMIEHKKKGWQGTFFHALIVVFFTAILLYPYWGHALTWFLIGILFHLHYIQDIIKIEFDKKFNKDKSTIPFFVDQTFHIAVLYCISKALTALSLIPLIDSIERIYYSGPLLILVIGILFSSYVWDKTKHQFKLKKQKHLEYQADYIGMLRRIIFFCTLYLLFFMQL
ncbi:DUF3307 domain-containing protein [Candidatus Peregrinibacteria bacterium]|jgi:hypothetical protein|nr:DUF3307 domain-containing protein [Candidatus Peregrinibacteria bacterium]MBT4631415.1 DUF3307 domain-containing protein [Candidatus Peregrinibacteria bacterium]MBT5516924.1 DUF3307 domain-containing protein [Candidatus Peregrinibacteria bacterium]MBT5824000.1 DUF3307 domain-containing protein [Candidatus Peregrinibacteria bacterium]